MRPVTYYTYFVLSVMNIVYQNANAQTVAPPAAQTVPASQESSCTSIIEAAQLRILNDNEKLILAKCVNESDIANMSSNTIGETRSTSHDIRVAPGPNNDIIRRDGWLGRHFPFQ